MKSILKTLKLLTDPTRLRIINVLNEESLSVAELQEILGMGQSRISTQLAQLRQEGVVEDTRSGKNVFYTLSLANDLHNVALKACEELPEADVLVRNVKKSFDDLLALNPHIGKDVVFAIVSSDDPAFLSEYMPANLLFRYEDKQAVMDEGTLNGRLDNNLVVEFPAEESLIGQYANVRLTGSRAALLVGELAE